MQIRGQLTLSELKSGASLFRPKSYWIKLAAGNLYAVLLMGVLAFVTLVSLIHFQTTNWREVRRLWLVIGFILLIALSLGKIRTSHTLRGINDQCAGTWRIDPDGIRGESEFGASSFTPWRAFSEWKRGKLAYVLKSKKGTLIILPIDELDIDDVSTLDGILRSSIGEPG